jgi:NIPSNAP
MLYEIATLSLRLGTAPKVVAGIDSYVREDGAKGRLLGCWLSEIGTLNQMIVLRGFDDAEELAAERRRARTSGNPFHCGEMLTDLRLDGYAPFPFLPPVTPGTFGKVYEIRTYALKDGGVEPTVAAWQAAIPERVKLSPLTIAMVALDGPARFTHIWPYASLDARAAVRADSVTKGIWPPKGGPDWLTGDMVSTIALPTAISPLA